MEYVKVIRVEEAQYWIPEYDTKFIGSYHTRKIVIAYRNVMTKLFRMKIKGDKHITYGKPYKLYFSENEDPMIIDDKGQRINLWLLHNGYFAKESEN